MKKIILFSLMSLGCIVVWAGVKTPDDAAVIEQQYVITHPNANVDEQNPSQLVASSIVCNQGKFAVDKSITVSISSLCNNNSTLWYGDLMMAILDGDSIVGTIDNAYTNVAIASYRCISASIPFTGVLPTLSNGTYRISAVYSANGQWHHIAIPRMVTITIMNDMAVIDYPGEEHTELHYTSSNGTSIDFDRTAFDVAVIETSYKDGLGTISFNGTLREILDDAFAFSSLATITIPSSVDHIGDYAFAFSDLVSITIPDGVSTIGMNILSQCDSLKYVVGPAECFYYDLVLNQLFAPAHIKRVVINSGLLTQSELDAIRLSYRTLRTIDVSKAVNTTLSDEAFRGCYNLDTLRLPVALEYIPTKAMAECKNLRSITIPASVVEIGASAFEDCRSLQSVTYGDSALNSSCALRRIGAWAFYHAHQLQHFSIPTGVEEIGEGAFYGCMSPDSVYLPASVRTIGDNSFALCTKLRSMCVDAATPPDIASKTFLEVSRHIPVYVPMDAVAAYKAHALWGEFDIRGRNIATGLECVDDNSDKASVKYLHNGLLCIRRGDNVYTLWGTQIQ